LTDQKAPTSTAPVQQELKQRRLSQKASTINTGKTGELPSADDGRRQ